MKKQYSNPSVEIKVTKIRTTLLAGSSFEQWKEQNTARISVKTDGKGNKTDHFDARLRDASTTLLDM